MKSLLEKTKLIMDDIEISWAKKVSVINTYHCLMRIADESRTFADTARDLQCSRAFISECIGLAKYLVDFPESIHLSRVQALRAMRANRSEKNYEI